MLLVNILIKILHSQLVRESATSTFLRILLVCAGLFFFSVCRNSRKKLQGYTFPFVIDLFSCLNIKALGTKKRHTCVKGEKKHRAKVSENCEQYGKN